jgi:predicted metal-dependent HD superfamily phosphohydrolase
VSTLEDRFAAACRGVGATATDAELRAAGTDLVRRWDEPQRRYHDRTHLLAVLQVIDECAGSDRARLAAWFHDAVYDPRASGNEQASAALAADVLRGLGVPAAVSADVARLVMLTAGHATVAGDVDGELLCDADLSVLGQNPRGYGDYAAQIRAEYAHVPDDAFHAGRAEILRALLALPALFRRPDLATRWESQARTNLRAELRTLSAR